VLAARYAEAFAEAQRCVPGEDTCNGSAPAVVADRLADGGTDISIDDCMNSCGGPNVNPHRTAALESALRAYRDACEHAVGCLCPRSLDGGPPAPYTCKPAADGGGVCSP